MEPLTNPTLLGIGENKVKVTCNEVLNTRLDFGPLFGSLILLIGSELQSG